MFSQSFLHGLRFIGDSKLTRLEVLALWQIDHLTRVYLASRPVTAGVGSSPLCDSYLDNWKEMDRWFSICEAQTSRGKKKKEIKMNEGFFF